MRIASLLACMARQKTLRFKAFMHGQANHKNVIFLNVTYLKSLTDSAILDDHSVQRQPS